MNFFTIRQYFNKLQIVLLLLLIGPLLAFLALHVLPVPTVRWENEFTVVIFFAILVEWLAALIIADKKIKSARNAQGLGAKLDKYFKITIVRFSFLSAASLTMALGLWATGNALFTGLYFAGMAVSFVFWPTGARVCSDLRLKGDEREMVYYKKDQL